MALTTTPSELTATALTLTTAAQPNITSVGTLTALTGGTGDLIWDTNTLVVDSSANNVGIGTTSPSEELHVNSAVSGQHTRVHITKTTTAGTAGVSLRSKDASNTWTIYSEDASASKLYFYDGADSVMTMDSANNRVGIGTTSPATELQVTKASSGATPTAGTVVTIEDDDNTELSILGGSSSVLAINFGHSGDNDEGKITFNTTAGSEDLQLVSSKAITLDAAGDITIDADDGDIYLKDGGTTFGQITTSSGDFHILQPTADKDIILRGLDGSTYIEALKLDMSEAGAATFNSGVTLSDGNLAFASGHGIDFGSTGNSSGSLGSELFSDYEEGTWTPVLISGGSTNPTGGGAIAPSGRYTKIGNRCFLTFYVGRSY